MTTTGAASSQVMWCCQVHPERRGLCSLRTKDRQGGCAWHSVFVNIWSGGMEGDFQFESDSILTHPEWIHCWFCSVGPELGV